MKMAVVCGNFATVKMESTKGTKEHENLFPPFVLFVESLPASF